jgi:hypothetical protein
MQDNKDLQIEYLVASINQQIKIENITSNCKLNIKGKVRLIESQKATFNANFYYRTIRNISGKSITFNDVDFSIKAVSESQSIPAETTT